jgi:putative ABC transport system permease protein
MTWLGGLYKSPRPDGEAREEFFANFGVDFPDFLDLYPEAKVPAVQVRDLLLDPGGCLVGAQLAKRLGKDLGDRITFASAVFMRPDGAPWQFTVRAIYTSDSPTFDQTGMFFHSRYLEEGAPLLRGLTGWYMVRLDDAAHCRRVSAAVDDQFANSPHETRTMTERAFNIQFVEMVGNLPLLLRTIGTAVLLTMLLISANTMMMNARERTREMGLLKALGFTNGYVAGLLAGEAVIVSLLGALCGAGGSYVLVNWFHYNPRPDFFPIFLVEGRIVAAAFLIAAVTGALSGIAPAISGWRLQVTEALRSV